MSMSGGDTGTTHQINEVKLPAWVEAASQNNYRFAQDVANRPLQQYHGQQVANLNDMQKSLPGLVQTLSGGTGAAWDDAKAALTSLLGYNPSTVQATGYDPAQLRGTDLQPYMSPYTDEVERRAISNAVRQGDIAQTGIASDATRKGAFGGSRQAIQSAVQGAETTRGIGDLSAQLREKNFTQAQSAAGTDVAARNEAAKFGASAQNTAALQNVANELTAKGLTKQAADSLVAAAAAGDAAAIQKIAATTSVGQMFYDQNQKKLDVKTKQAQERINYPLEQLNILLSALGMSPYGKTETSTGKTEQKNGMDLSAILSAAIGAGAKMYTASDRTLKTDIERLGTDPSTALPIYAYRYKGDPKSYPKVVGPMAQDVEKRYPHAVRKVNGKRVIDMTALAAV